MSVDIELGDEAVIIRVRGWDALWSFRRELRLPLRDVVGATVISRREALAGLGWRVRGGYWPGAMATGVFAVPGRRGARQWWCVYRDPEVLVIETRLERPARVVVQHPDRHRLARLIDQCAASGDGAGPGP